MELNINQYSIVKAVTEVDLLSLFNSSIESMNNGTFWFPADLHSNESKFEYFENIVNRLFSNNEAFAYKRTIAGKDVSFHIGERHGTAFMLIIGLITSIDNSKSWIYIDEAYEQEMQLLINNNFTRMIAYNRKDSATEKHIIERYTTVLGADIQTAKELGEMRYTLIKFPINQE
jgi:hypothetical protein